MYSYSYTTVHTCDKANQLVSSTTDGKVTHYAYDAAGRLIKEGDKFYAYGLDQRNGNISVSASDQQKSSINDKEAYKYVLAANANPTGGKGVANYSVVFDAAFFQKYNISVSFGVLSIGFPNSQGSIGVKTKSFSITSIKE